MTDKKKKPEKFQAKRYSVKERMAALVLLRDNGYNFTKTARQANVSVPSLRHWYKKYANDLREQSEAIEAIVESTEDLQDQKKDLMTEIYDTQLLIIKRVQELIPSARSIRVLSDALAIIHSLEAEVKNPAGAILGEGGHRDFIMQFVSNQIAIVENGKITRANKVINEKTEDHVKN